MELPRKWFGSTSKNASALVLYWLVRILYVSFRSVLSRRVVELSVSTGRVSKTEFQTAIFVVYLVVHGFQMALFVSRIGRMIAL